MHTSMNNIPKREKYSFTMLVCCTAFINNSIMGILGPCLPDLICINKSDLKSISSLFVCFGIGKFTVCCFGIFLKDKVNVALTVVLALVSVGFLLPAVPNSTFLLVTDALHMALGCFSGMLCIGQLLMASLLWPKSNSGIHAPILGAGMASIFTPLLSSAFVHQESNARKFVVTKYILEDNATVAEISNCETDIVYPYIMLSVLTLLTATGMLICSQSIDKKGFVLDQQILVDPGTNDCDKTRQFKWFTFLLMIMFGTITASWTSVISLTVTYGLRSNLHLDVYTTSSMTSFFSLSLLLSRIICFLVADRIKPDYILWFSFSLLTINAVIFIIFKDSNIVMLWIISCLHGFGTGPIFGTLFVFGRRYVKRMSRYICLLLALDEFGNLVHPTGTSILMDLYGANMFIYTIAGTRFFQLCLFFALSVLAGQISVV